MAAMREAIGLAMPPAAAPAAAPPPLMRDKPVERIEPAALATGEPTEMAEPLVGLPLYADAESAPAARRCAAGCR